jgi:leucyl aminopeptidase (aminopeptidase T)
MLASPLDSRADLLQQLPVLHVDAPGGVDVAVEVAATALAAELATTAERNVQLAARRACLRRVFLTALDEDVTGTVHLVL